MSTLTYVVMAIQLLCAIALIAIITIQSGKSAGLAGAIGGGSETFLGKGKSKTLDAKLASATKWVALVWIIVTLLLGLVK